MGTPGCAHRGESHGVGGGGGTWGSDRFGSSLRSLGGAGWSGSDTAAPPRACKVGHGHSVPRLSLPCPFQPPPVLVTDFSVSAITQGCWSWLQCHCFPVSVSIPVCFRLKLQPPNSQEAINPLVPRPRNSPELASHVRALGGQAAPRLLHELAQSSGARSPHQLPPELSWLPPC